MQKIRELDWGPGHIVPVVRIKITKDKEIPAQKEEIEILPNVPTFIMRGENLYYYMIALGNTSKRIIPKKLIYKGTEKLPFFSGSFSFFYNTMSEIMIH